jgi:hypothetical protein
MSPAMAARTLILCGLVVGGLQAHAQPRVQNPIRIVRRPVAVIDLSNDQPARDFAIKLLDLLASQAELAPPAISDGAALVDKLPPDDEVRLAEARKKQQSAEQNLQLRNFREAAIDAVEGQELLLRVTPRAAVGLYADLALALGQSRLGEKKDAQAREAFALTYRLDPHRTLDDLHYLPEVVQTFEAAQRATSGIGTIVVRGVGRVWIDGEEVGSSPGEFRASYGRHVVWLTELLRDTAGKEVTVTATRSGDATILDGTLTRPQKVARFRVALADAKDPASRASAMARLAAFVNVHDAVLMSSLNGRVMYQTWRDQEPGFSALKELEHETPAEVLKRLLPEPPPEVFAPPVFQPPVVATRWYRRPRVQIGVAATVVAALIGGYLWAHAGEPDRPWNTNIGLAPGTDKQ